MEEKKYYVAIAGVQKEKQDILFEIGMYLHKYEMELTDEGKETLYSGLVELEKGNLDGINLKMLSLTEVEANDMVNYFKEKNITLEVRSVEESVPILEVKVSEPRKVPELRMPEPRKAPEPRMPEPRKAPEPRMPEPRMPEPKMPEPKTVATLDIEEIPKTEINKSDISDGLKNKLSAGKAIIKKTAGEQKEKTGEFLAQQKDKVAEKKQEAREKAEQEEAAKPNPNAGKQVINTKNKIKYKFRQVYCETGKKPFKFLDAFILSFLALAAGYGMSLLLVMIIGEEEILVLIGFILGALICWGLDYFILYKKFKGKAKNLIMYNILASIAFFCTFFLWPIIKFSYQLGKAAFHANLGNTAASVHASKSSKLQNNKSSFDWFEYDKYIQ